MKIIKEGQKEYKVKDIIFWPSPSRLLLPKYFYIKIFLFKLNSFTHPFLNRVRDFSSLFLL
ncbi:unnamed protein product [Meloidogyne enterolobii]|uniref:Uncharacterized protein n=1 Tax=Meloidogyne enterolobii TaxID=390850 RepID=A0ACB0XY19_MELEN